MYVKESTHHQVTTWLIDRPERANGLGTTIGYELHQLAQSLDVQLQEWLNSNNSQPPCKALVIKATPGGKNKNIWIAGGDLKELSQLTDKKSGRTYAETLTKTCNLIENLPIPVIAIIDGHAIGGGLEFALAANLRIGSPKATFHFKQLMVGLSTGYGSAARLSDILGAQRALSFLLTGKVVPADQALELGLLHELQSDQKCLETRLKEILDHLSQLNPKAIANQKKMLLGLNTQRQKEHQKKELEWFEQLWLNDHHKSFLDQFNKPE